MAHARPSPPPPVASAFPQFPLAYSLCEFVSKRAVIPQSLLHCPAPPNRSSQRSSSTLPVLSFQRPRRLLPGGSFALSCVSLTHAALIMAVQRHYHEFTNSFLQQIFSGLVLCAGGAVVNRTTSCPRGAYSLVKEA